MREIIRAAFTGPGSIRAIIADVLGVLCLFGTLYGLLFLSLILES